MKLGPTKKVSDVERELNRHPHRLTDAISFYPSAKTNQCRCRHRDPLVVSHPASGLWFQLCKSCGDRVGKAMYEHPDTGPTGVTGPTGTAGMSKRQREALNEHFGMSAKEVAIWSSDKLVDKAEYEASDIMRDIKRRHMQSRLFFYNMVGAAIVICILALAGVI